MFYTAGKEHALLICNHRSDIDWLVGWQLAKVRFLCEILDFAHVMHPECETLSLQLDLICNIEQFFHCKLLWDLIWLNLFFSCRGGILHKIVFDASEIVFDVSDFVCLEVSWCSDGIDCCTAEVRMSGWHQGDHEAVGEIFAGLSFPPFCTHSATIVSHAVEQSIFCV